MKYKLIYALVKACQEQKCCKVEYCEKHHKECIGKLLKCLLDDGQTAYQRWIPVTERLPSADICVLVITANGNYKTARCNIYRTETTEVCWMTNDGLGEMAITHWMPLPHPPKEES